MSHKNPIRIPPLPAEGASDAAREVFAFWGEPGAWENGSRTNVINVMAQHPTLGQAYNQWGKQLLIDNTIPNREREIIILRLAWNMKSEYEWHWHVGYGLNFGMSLEEIAAIRVGAEDEIWGEKDRAILTGIDDLMNYGTMSDDTWAALSKHFDQKQMMDFVFMTGHYVMTSWAIHAFGVQLEDWVDPIGFDLKTASGETPGARERPLDE